MVFLAKGTFTLGFRTFDGQGNVIKETKAKFTTDPDGGSVAVGTLDDDTMEPTGKTELFGDFQPWEYLNCALKLLAPKRPGDIPDFENIFKRMYERETHCCPFRPYCESGISCGDCICWTWIAETEENEE